MQTKPKRKPRPLATSIAERDLYWLAGWLEGEGSFQGAVRMDHGYPTFKISVGARCTDRDVVEHAYDTFGGTMGGPYDKKQENWKPYWQWGVQSRADSLRLMRLLRPLLGERRQAQIDAALAAEAAGPRRVPARHGTISKYNGGCKCTPCRLAQNEYQRNRRRRLREAANAG